MSKVIGILICEVLVTIIFGILFFLNTNRLWYSIMLGSLFLPVVYVLMSAAFKFGEWITDNFFD